MGQYLNGGYQKLQVQWLNLVPDETLDGLAHIEANGRIKMLTNKLYMDGRISHTGSCGIIARAFLRSARPILDTSTPSIVTEPDDSSTKRYKAED